MHEGMAYDYDPIQGQGQGHGASEVAKIFQIYLLCYLQWELANDH